jgi:aryl-alcohol dehydrogenase-like predicted oxidoreductase
MKERKLGPSGPIVGAVGYGAMSFSDFYGKATDEGSMAILDECLDLGITHIDTSDIYGVGRSETVIGEWIKRKGSNPFSIATKGGIKREADENGRFDNSSAYLTSALDASLQRLRIDCVDLYYLHRRDPRWEIEEVAGTLAGFVKAGKCKSIGLSEVAPDTLRRAHAVHPVAAVQSEYSLSTRAPELGLVQACAELGTALVAFSPVGRALLTDTPHSRDSAKAMPFLANNPRFMEPNISANLAKNASFCALAADMGVAAASLAIAWLLHQGRHVLPIPGTRSVTHLREVAAGAEVNLSSEDLTRIEEVLPVGWAAGDRYSAAQWIGPERFC